MYGRNPVADDLRRQDGKLLSLVGQPWTTLQGEGPFMGHPATFVRLHGCNLRCTFCDTEFSDPELLSEWSLNSVVQFVSVLDRTLVVITGGEPCRQNIGPLVRALHSWGFTVQIETAGTLWVPGIEPAHIVVSPKTPKLATQMWHQASTFKYIIDHRMQFDRFVPICATQPGTEPTTLALPRPGAPVYLSPMDTGNEDDNARNRVLVAKLAMEYKVYATLQMHKLMGLP